MSSEADCCCGEEQEQEPSQHAQVPVLQQPGLHSAEAQALLLNRLLPGNLALHHSIDAIQV